MRFSLFLLLCIIFLFYLSGCSDKSITEPVANYDRGELITATDIFSYSANDIKQLLQILQIPDTLVITYNVRIVKIIYQTSNVHGNLIRASGVIFIPDNDDQKSLLSLQHGTVTKQNNVASENPGATPEGITGLMITSGKGYITCLPDYPGFGISSTLHPYIHAKSLAMSIVDFLHAVKTYCTTESIALDGQLFLAGYSEGGYATLAAQREIEQNYSTEFSITAVAPMSGPYDLSGTLETILQQSFYDWPAYIAFLLTAYDDIYNWQRLDEIFMSPYAGRMHDLFDGDLYFYEINNQLPANISQLLKADFISRVLSGTDSTTINAFEENTLLDWTPQAPIRFFHGDADIAVPYQNAVTARDNLLANGASHVDLVTISGGTHETSGLPAIFGMINWFDTY